MIKILFIAVVLVCSGCGLDASEPEYKPYPKDPAGDGSYPGGGSGSSGGSSGGSGGGSSLVTLAQVRPILDEQCSSCHPTSVLQDKASLLKFGALARIKSDSMPLRSGRNYALYNQQKKDLLVAFLEQP